MSKTELVEFIAKEAGLTKADAARALDATLAGITAVTDAATDHFFRTYNFHVYDINLYNAIKELDAGMLVQDIPAPTPAASAAPAAE